MPEIISVIGVEGSGRLGASPDEITKMLIASDVVVGSERQLGLLETQASVPLPYRIGWENGFDAIVEALSACQRAATVLASGDPGYFGVVRLLRSKFPHLKLNVYPVASSVSLAFAKLGMNWEDSTVVSAHGRDHPDVLIELIQAASQRSDTTKLAVFCSPDHPPQFVAQLLLEMKSHFDRYIVATDIGGPDEAFHEDTLDHLTKQIFHHHSIFIAVTATESSSASTSNRTAQPASEGFLHRDGMITKAETRELAFAKLDPYLSGDGKCFWDLGAGSGSVGLTAAERNPSLRVTLVDSDPISLRLISINSSHLSNVTLVHARAEDILDRLDPPAAVFIGGGGIDLLDAVLTHLENRAFILCTHASINRATEAANRLGNLMQVILPVGKRLKDGTWRLEGENPVFMSWGLSR